MNPDKLEDLRYRVETMSTQLRQLEGWCDEIREMIYKEQDRIYDEEERFFAKLEQEFAHKQ